MFDIIIQSHWNRKESESISRIGIGIEIDKIQMIPNPSRAAAFWIICRGLIVFDGSPARRALQ